jgi:ABC-type glutathione transport system ATPase component
MTKLLHIVGPQGAGKTMITQVIVGGAPGRAAHLYADEARGLSNAQIREQFASMYWVCVEAESLGPRHDELLPGDAVMTICGALPATRQQVMFDAA